MSEDNLFDRRDDDDSPIQNIDDIKSCYQHDELDCEICAGDIDDSEPHTVLGDHFGDD